MDLVLSSAELHLSVGTAAMLCATWTATAFLLALVVVESRMPVHR